MKLTILLSSALVLAALPQLASATDISTINLTVTSSSPTQLGRLSRNGVQQTWNGDEAYPGVINPAVTYSYTTYTFAASLFTGIPYVEISDYDTLKGTSLFLSAYAGAYDPTNLASNWLGDEGASGNYFGTDARFFDVVLPVGKSLVLVLNTSAAAGLNDPHTINVSAFTDTDYDDPAPATTPTTTTPEPSTFITLGTGLLGVAGAARRRLRRA